MRRLPVRRRHAAFAVLSAGILITAGCGGGSVGKDTRAAEAAQAAASAKVTLLPLTSSGPHPFTTSTAAPVPDASPSRPPSPSGPATRSQTLRSVSGAIAGLYGGTKSTPSCDVDAQVRLLTGDRAKAVAFARAAASAPRPSPPSCAGSPPSSCAPTYASRITATGTARPPPSRPYSRAAPPSSSTTTDCPGSAAPAETRCARPSRRAPTRPTRARRGAVTGPTG